jgi:hypothetical protein
MPATAVDIIAGFEKGQLLADTSNIAAALIQFKLRQPGQDFFFDRPQLQS